MQMRLTSITLAAATTLVAACGPITPSSLREKGNAYTYQSTLAPDAMANCIVQRTPEFNGMAMGQKREAKAPNAEVAIFQAGGLAAIVDITPNPNGSTMAVSIVRFLMTFEEDRILGGMRSCGTHAATR